MVIVTQIDPEVADARLHEKLHLSEAQADGTLNAIRRRELHDAETIPTPKFEIHQVGMKASTAADLVRKHLALDGRAELNLASFVHTGIDPEGLELCRENITKNLADSDEYPALMDIHQRCVSIISNLWNVPKGELGVGTATTGSSEAIMLGGLAMKRRWQQAREAKGLPTDKPNIIMGKNAQVALEKFARYFEVEPRLLDVHASSHFSFSMDDLRKNVDENTIGVFAILGSTYTGHYQDIEAVSKVLDEYEEKTGHSVPIHVDGASGGFVAPFCSSDLVWDFRLRRVHSINASGHKFGLAPVGCGWIIWRDKKYLPTSLLFTLKYLGGTEETYTLNFSRPGHPIIYQYYSLLKNGFDGYYTTHLISLENARVLSMFLEDTGYFDVISDIHRTRGVYYYTDIEKSATSIEDIRNIPLEHFNDGLPVVSFKLSDAFKKDYPYVPQESISYMLRGKGYIIPNYPLPEGEEKYEVLRVVINDNVSLDLIDKLSEDIVRVTNILISIGNTLGVHANQEDVRKAIAIISSADHKEEEHQDKWSDYPVNHSRC